MNIIHVHHMNKYNSLRYSRATLKVAITNLAKSLLWDLSVYLLASVAKRLDNTYPLGISLFLFLVRRSKTPSILRRKNPKIHTTPDKCNLDGERHCASKVSCPRTQHHVPSQGSNPDHSIQS